MNDQPDFRYDFEGAFFQDMRLVDTLLLGPFMVWAGWKGRKMPDWARLVLGVSGVLTMAFNFRNYAELKRGG